MTIPEYLAGFIKVRPNGNRVEVYFEDIIWEGHTPGTQDVLVYELSLASWGKNKEKYTSRILNNKKYFHICGLCGEVNHRGHMHDAYVCQRCAEINHHVIY